MKHKLTLQERFTLMGILPQEGSFVTLKILRDCNSELGLKDEEHKEYEISQDGPKVTWNMEKDKEL